MQNILLVAGVVLADDFSRCSLVFKMFKKTFHKLSCAKLKCTQQKGEEGDGIALWGTLFLN